MTRKRTEFAAWLEGKFTERQAELRRRITLDEFAEEIGVSRPLLSQYLNGSRTPGARSLARIASVLGPEVYDALRLPRPKQYQDEKLRFILDNWGRLSEDARRRVFEIVTGEEGKAN